jgi:hypothetical protein
VETEVTLQDGSIWTSQGDHQWQDAGLPGMSRCECGISRHYDRSVNQYTYKEDK